MNPRVESSGFPVASSATTTSRWKRRLFDACDPDADVRLPGGEPREGHEDVLIAFDVELVRLVGQAGESEPPLRVGLTGIPTLDADTDGSIEGEAHVRRRSVRTEGPPRDLAATEGEGDLAAVELRRTDLTCEHDGG